jgi:hypothetical protein
MPLGHALPSPPVQRKLSGPTMAKGSRSLNSFWIFYPPSRPTSAGPFSPRGASGHYARDRLRLPECRALMGGSALTAVHCLSYFAPRRRRNQRQKGSVMQLHGVTLSFHRQVYDASREFVWPNVVMAVSSESYPRFIKSCFHDHEGLGIKRAIAKAVHVPLPAIEPAMKHS